MNELKFFNNLNTNWKQLRLKNAVALSNLRIEGYSNDNSYVGLENIESKTGKLLLKNEDQFVKMNDEDKKTIVNVFKKNDVLFSKLRPYLTKAFIAENDGISSTELLVFKTKPKIKNKFLLYILLSPNFIDLVNSSAYGTKMPRADWDFIREIYVPIPPIEEQNAIAEMLDHETARLDELITEKERLLELLAEKRRAIITHAVTRGLNESTKLKDSGIEWLGKNPEHWEKIRLKFLADSIQTGPFGSQLHAEDYVSNGIPVINPVHIINGKIIPNSLITVDFETAERLAVHKLKPRDVIFARRGELGRCGVVSFEQENWICGTGSIKARLKKNILPEYLVEFVRNSGASSWLQTSSVGTTMDNLNTEILGELHILVPPLEEQKKIVDFIEAETHKIDSLKKVTKSTIELLKERRSSLITAAVTGKIKVT